MALRDGLLRRELLAGVGAGGGRSVLTTDASIRGENGHQNLSTRERRGWGVRGGAVERRGWPELAVDAGAYRRLRRNGGAANGQPGGGVLGFRGWRRRGERGALKGTDAGVDCGLNGDGVISGRRDCRGRGRD